MARIYKKHSSTFKAKVAMAAIKEQKTLGELNKEHSVAPTQISTWKKHVKEKASALLKENKKRTIKRKLINFIESLVK